MNQKRFPEEFKIEAVRQIVERGHPVAEVSARLGVSTHSLYKWIKEQQLPPGQRQEQLSQTEELRRLKAAKLAAFQKYGYSVDDGLTTGDSIEAALNRVMEP